MKRRRDSDLAKGHGIQAPGDRDQRVIRGSGGPHVDARVCLARHNAAYMPDAYTPQPMASPMTAPIPELVQASLAHRLVICAGAGLSRARRADLPDGRSLSIALDTRLNGKLTEYQSPHDIGDLIAVADAAVAANGRLSSLQIEVADSAKFRTAPPNYGHAALAMLTLEGAVQAVLLWNWDTCIERTCPEGEHLHVARSEQDLQGAVAPCIAKVHGCAEVPVSMLITSEQLAESPLWVEQAFAQRISNSTIIFIGIGDVADYARRRIERFNQDFGGTDDLDAHIVSPSIRTHWDQSVWSDVLPALDEQRKIEATADAFLDELIRGWARVLPESVEAVRSQMSADAASGALNVIDSFSQLNAVEAVRWCRDAAIGAAGGQSVVHTREAHSALLATAVLSGDSAGAPVTFRRRARFQVGDTFHECLLVCATGTVATDVVAEARSRVERLIADDLLRGSATFLVAGDYVGTLDAADLGGTDLVSGEVDTPDDVFAPTMGLRFIKASDLTDRAA